MNLNDFERYNAVLSIRSVINYLEDNYLPSYGYEKMDVVINMLVNLEVDILLDGGNDYGKRD